MFRTLRTGGVRSPSDQVRIAIVGAGFGGLCAAFELRSAGYRNIVVYERAPDVGGTWQANTYPGAACDAPSHIYSYSFAQDVDWSRRFAPGPEIQQYLRNCVLQAGLESSIRTDTEVTEAAWSGSEWSITLGDGTVEKADVLVPAVGHLCVPIVPDIAGLNSFEGTVFHSARWDHTVDLTGRTVAFVGTGATAVQAIPAIAEAVGHLTVFQRSAPYVMSKPDAVYSDRAHRLYRRLPPARSIARASIWGAFELFNYSFWKHPAAMAMLQRVHRRHLKRQVPDPALRAALTPDYDIGCKRIPIANDYYPTMNRPDVDLVTDPITEVTADGVATATGHHPADVIIFATGFETDRFMSSIVVRGRDGRTLDHYWTEGAGAYLGMSVPNFPNMFLMWGPNTNLGAGSIVYMMEAQAAHIVGAVDMVAERPGTTVEVDTTAYLEFLDEIRTKQTRTIWAGCRNWYHDHHGNDVHNWHGSMREYRRRVRRLDSEHYRVRRVDRLR